MCLGDQKSMSFCEKRTYPNIWQIRRETVRLLFILWTLKVLFQDILNTCFYIPINNNACESVLKMFVTRSKLDETMCVCGARGQVVTIYYPAILNKSKLDV